MDEDGSNVVYWAVQGWLLRKNTNPEAPDAATGSVSAAGRETDSPSATDHGAGSATADRSAHLRILEKILAEKVKQVLALRHSVAG